MAAPEVEHAYTQAHALCQQVGETPELVPVLYGLCRFYLGRLQLHTAREIGETLLRLAQRADDPALAVIAHYALGATWLFLGALPAARLHLEEAIARYTPDQRRALVFRIGARSGCGLPSPCRTDPLVAGVPGASPGPPPRGPGVGARAAASLIVWRRRGVGRPTSLSFAGTCQPCTSRQRPPSRSRPSRAFHSGRPRERSCAGGRWPCRARARRGWPRSARGSPPTGPLGHALLVPYYCTLLADVSAHLGHPEDGLQALAEAHTLVEQHEERWWEAEICRLRGVLLLRQPGTPQAEAEAWLQRALDVARRQEAKSLELRAAMSLSRLWQQQGKQAEARELLAPIYGWFTEGFDTADLQEAKTLLEELGGNTNRHHPPLPPLGHQRLSGTPQRVTVQPGHEES